MVLDEIDERDNITHNSDVCTKVCSASRITRFGAIGIILLIMALVFSAGVASAAVSTIIVNTDRYVVLDDPIEDGGTAASPYVLPQSGGWLATNDRWGGQQTTIGAYALIMGDDGQPMSGTTINFTIKNPVGTTRISGSSVTNASGVANFFEDLDNAKYYGVWSIEADSGGLTSSTTFVYNWWGCAWGDGCGGFDRHDDRDPNNEGSAAANSPYMASWEKVTIKEPEHNIDLYNPPNSGGDSGDFGDDYCTVCHQTYDGNPTNSISTGTVTKDWFVDDVHSSKRCDEPLCHDPGSEFANHNDGTMVIGDCDNCHTRTNFSMKTTLSGSGSTAVSSYSNGSSAYSEYHTSSSTVPCVICHGPMHNITKPDPTVGGLDSDTEDSHCTTCHESQGNHTVGSNPVYCTACHSQDAHVIGVIDKTSSTYPPAFVNVSATNAMEVTDCIECHQPGPEATYFASLTDLSGYGYTIDYTPATPTHKNHNGTITCTECHNGTDSNTFHNIEFIKPDATFSTSNATAAECMDCHTTPEATMLSNFSTLSDKQKESHGPTANCTICHNNTYHSVWLLNNTGTYIENGTTTLSTNEMTNCTACHQGSDITSTEIGVSNFPKVAVPMQHSNNASNGSLWNGTPYWDSTNETDKCMFCHVNTSTGELEVHSTNAIGKSIYIQGSNETIADDTFNGYWCANCHLQSAYDYNGTAFSPIPPPTIKINNTGNITSYAYASLAWYNHSFLTTFDDDICSSCHALAGELPRPGSNITTLMHNVEYGIEANSNCVGCHVQNGAAGIHYIDRGAINASTSIHSGLNSAVARSGNAVDDDKICWGCHSTNGTEPVAHPDRKANPWKCPDCHVGNQPGIANLTSVASAPIVYEHYKGANVSVNNATFVVDSCIKCHSVSGLVNSSYTDENITARAEVAHYGFYDGASTTYRTGASADCAYCHQNATSDFKTVMTKSVYSSNMTNHTTWSDSPTCTNSTCHAGGWLHNLSLQKPALNDNLCDNAGCHSSKPKHNSQVNCINCHTNDSSTDADIHSIKFLQIDATYSASNSSATAADCTTCHQGSTVSITTINVSSLPKIQFPMQHSNNASNGSIWNATGYWTNQSTACDYCHGDTIHDASALGKPDQFNGSNLIGATDFTNGTWCASCHYQGYSDYATTITTMSPVPPEISNNTTYAPSGISGYLNHSLSTYNDSACNACHYPNAANSTLLMHGTQVGSGGGPDCASSSCHGLSGAKPVNITAMNLSAHNELNSATTSGVSLTAGNITKACWLCHDDGLQPTIEDHNGYNSISVKGCDDSTCHNDPSSSVYMASHSSNTSAVYVQTNSTTTTCEFCHSLTDVNISTNITQTGTIDMMIESGASFVNTTAHYVRDPVNATTDEHSVIDTVGWDGGSQGCVYCHKTDNATKFNSIDIRGSSSSAHSTGENCYVCHIRGTTTLHDAGVFNATAGGPDCVYCHANSTSPSNDVNYSAMNTSMHANVNSGANTTNVSDPLNAACWACHGNGSNPGNQHPNNSATSPYNNTYLNPLDCTSGNCHTSNNTLYSAPAVYEHIPGNTSIFPTIGYGTLTTCVFCHNNSINTTYTEPAFGSFEPAVGDNSSDAIVAHYGLNTSLLTPTTDCNLCHRGSIANVTDYNVTESSIRHPAKTNESTFCKNCHGQPTSSFHNDAMDYGQGDIHMSFDWEND
ncbi:MAG: hypothetical protein KAH86_00780, partial [Methanosarcinales archaeon]|nr:hypothetical protein [Methanosarcinales archaeon]